MSRTKNSVRNTNFAAIRYFVQIFLQFALQTAFIYVLGVRYLGLNSFFTTFVGVLALLDLGFGAAAGYSMYKPMADKDYKKVKALNHYYKRFYMYVMIFMAVLGVALTPLVPLMVAESADLSVNIFVVYYIFVVNLIITYAVSNKRIILFTSQRNDIINKAALFRISFMKILQGASLFIFANFYVFIVLIPLSTLLENYLISRYTNKLIPQLKEDAEPLDEETKKEIKTNIKASLFHKVGGVLNVFLIEPIILIFFNLYVLGLSANYLLITMSVWNFILLLGTAFQGSVGNLIASSPKEKVYQTFKKVNLAFWLILGWATACIIVLSQPFVTIWLGTDRLLSFAVVLAIAARLFVHGSRLACNVFRDSAGLMRKDKYAPITEVVLTIGLIFIFHYWFGLAGIFLASATASIMVSFWWTPLVVYKSLFNQNVGKYFLGFMLFATVVGLATLASHYIVSYIPVRWYFLALKLAVVSAVIGSMYLVVYFNNKEFRSLVKTFTNLIRKK